MSGGATTASASGTASVTDTVPALRFPEFEGAWSQKALADLTVSAITYGVVQPGSNNADGVPFVRGGDFPNGEIDTSQLRKIPQSISDQYRRTQLTGGELLISLVGYPGSCTIASKDLLGANVARQVAVARIKAAENPLYIYQYIRSDIGQKKLLRKVIGSAQQVINLVDLRKIVLAKPQLSEQKKIAAFLGVVDERLAKLRERVALFERYKRGLMQALFSQSLRFTRSDGTAFPDWEEKRLGEVLTIGSGRDYKHLSKGDIPVYGTGGYMTSVDAYLYDGESVCIGRKGTIDNPVLLTGKFWTVDTLFYTHEFRGIIPYFLLAVFLQINWKKHNEASGVPSLSKATIEKLKFDLPHPDEQQRIAEALSAMDAKIAAVSGQVTQMEAFKKGLLQQMFV